MFYGSYVLYIFLFILLLYLFRMAWLKYQIRQALANNANGGNQALYAPYFIRIRAMTEQRIQSDAAERRRANELPPKYEDIVPDGPSTFDSSIAGVHSGNSPDRGRTNPGYSFEEPPPEYSTLTIQSEKPVDARPGRF